MKLYLLQLLFLLLTLLYLANNKDFIVDSINNIIHDKESFAKFDYGLTIGLIFYTIIIAIVVYLLLPRGMNSNTKDLSPAAAFMKSYDIKL